MFPLGRSGEASGPGDCAKVAELMDLHALTAPHPYSESGKALRSAGDIIRGNLYGSNRNYILDLWQGGALEWKSKGRFHG